MIEVALSNHSFSWWWSNGVSKSSWLISDKRYNRTDLTRSNEVWNVACTSGFMVVLLPDRSSRVETGLTPLCCSWIQSWKAKSGITQGSHRFWKSGKSEKIGRHFSSQGKVRVLAIFSKIREFWWPNIFFYILMRQYIFITDYILITLNVIKNSFILN